jgi:hypothetical protein
MGSRKGRREEDTRQPEWRQCLIGDFRTYVGEMRRLRLSSRSTWNTIASRSEGLTGIQNEQMVRLENPGISETFLASRNVFGKNDTG